MKIFLVISVIFLFVTPLYAGEVTIPIRSLQTQQTIGSIVVKDGPYGLVLLPKLSGLSPGAHGFHVHANSSCADNGMAAGGHFDPKRSNKHLGPYQLGHLGDLPVLIVDARGVATLPLLAPRLTVKQIRNHALVIHQGGDNYSDIPKKLGGGGSRAACGVIPSFTK